MKFPHATTLGLGVIASLLVACVDQRQITPEQAELARTLRQDLRASTSLPVDVYIQPDARVDVELEGIYTPAQINALRTALTYTPHLPVGTHLGLLIHTSHIDEPIVDVNGVSKTRRRALDITTNDEVEVKAKTEAEVKTDIKPTPVVPKP